MNVPVGMNRERERILKTEKIYLPSVFFKALKTIKLLLLLSPPEAIMKGKSGAESKQWILPIFNFFSSINLGFLPITSHILRDSSPETVQKNPGQLELKAKPFEKEIFFIFFFIEQILF